MIKAPTPPPTDRPPSLRSALAGPIPIVADDPTKLPLLTVKLHHHGNMSCRKRTPRVGYANNCERFAMTLF